MKNITKQSENMQVWYIKQNTWQSKIKRTPIVHSYIVVTHVQNCTILKPHKLITGVSTFTKIAYFKTLSSA